MLMMIARGTLSRSPASLISFPLSYSLSRSLVRRQPGSRGRGSPLVATAVVVAAAGDTQGVRACEASAGGRVIRCSENRRHDLRPRDSSHRSTGSSSVIDAYSLPLLSPSLPSSSSSTSLSIYLSVCLLLSPSFLLPPSPLVWLLICIQLSGKVKLLIRTSCFVVVPLLHACLLPPSSPGEMRVHACARRSPGKRGKAGCASHSGKCEHLDRRSIAREIITHLMIEREINALACFLRCRRASLLMHAFRADSTLTPVFFLSSLFLST